MDTGQSNKQKHGKALEDKIYYDAECVAEQNGLLFVGTSALKWFKELESPNVLGRMNAKQRKRWDNRKNKKRRDEYSYGEQLVIREAHYVIGLGIIVVITGDFYIFCARCEALLCRGEIKTKVRDRFHGVARPKELFCKFHPEKQIEHWYVTSDDDECWKFGEDGINLASSEVEGCTNLILIDNPYTASDDFTESKHIRSYSSLPEELLRLSNSCKCKKESNAV